MRAVSPSRHVAWYRVTEEPLDFIEKTLCRFVLRWRRWRPRSFGLRACLRLQPGLALFHILAQRQQVGVARVHHKAAGDVAAGLVYLIVQQRTFDEGGVACGDALQAGSALAIIDIVNSGTWLIVVVLLEAEVWMQLKDRLTAGLLRIGNYVKGFFYAVLFVCAIYWWFYGDFLDFWDAFLWLVAFIFIELNIFQWHEETESVSGRGTAGLDGIADGGEGAS